MQRSTRFSRPGLKGSTSRSLMFSSGDMFVLSASPASTTAVNLAWTAFLPTPDTYRIERSTDGISFSTVTSAAANVFSYQDTGRTESTQYWYRIVPVIGGADQIPSNVADTWTVPATPTTLTATAVGGTQIDLTWVDVSTGNTAQVIERRTPSGSGSYSLLATVSATATTYSDTGLTPGQSYEYRVAATNPVTQSAYSNTASATPSATPTAAWTLDFSSGTPSGYTLTRASSGTYVDSSGYIASASTDIARLTHNSSGSRLGLLVEGQRTNLILQSEDFTTTWTNSNTTEPTTNNTAPDGTATADEIRESAATSANYWITQGGISVTSGTVYTLTVYAKAGTATVLQMTAGSGQFGSNEWANFNLSAGVLGSVGSAVTGSDATIENVGSGWYRCKLTMTAVATATSSVFLLFTNNNASAARAPTYTVTAGNERSLYLWGAQLEAASTATSYIPTTTASVIRSADLVHVLDSSITNWGDPGALVVHFYPPGQAGTLISTDDASTAQVGIEASTTTAARAFWSSGSTATGTIGSGVQKAVHYWTGSTSKFAINGGTVQSGTNNFTIANADFVTLGAEATESGGVPGTFSQYANCIIRKVEFYSGTLTDANLQTITT